MPLVCYGILVTFLEKFRAQQDHNTTQYRNRLTSKVQLSEYLMKFDLKTTLSNRDSNNCSNVYITKTGIANKVTQSSKQSQYAEVPTNLKLYLVLLSRIRRRWFVLRQRMCGRLKRWQRLCVNVLELLLRIMRTMERCN